MLSLKSLQCFVTLVKTKSFTRTAEELYLTQPTISKILQQLEEQLQVQLLVKPDHGRKRQIELTEIESVFINMRSNFFRQSKTSF